MDTYPICRHEWDKRIKHEYASELGIVEQIHGWTLFHLSYERNVHACAEPIEHTGNLKTLTNALRWFDPIFGRYGLDTGGFGQASQTAVKHKPPSLGCVMTR